MVTATTFHGFFKQLFTQDQVDIPRIPMKDKQLRNGTWNILGTYLMSHNLKRENSPEGV